MMEDELARFDKSINEFGNKFRNTFSDTRCQMVGLRDVFKDSIEALAEKLSVKLKEEEQMIEMFLEYQNQICRQNKLIQEKKDALLKLITEVKDKKQEMEVLTAKIQDLKEEYSRKKESNKLQFIFTSIDPKHPERPFMFSLHLNEARDYEVSDSAPHLECLAEFQENVRKTNNFSAFIANVRKAFTAMVYN
ncbi:kinetochore protein Spc25 isoform X3 [Ictidomys tridecemlineatus]|uniref:kinetochore protein Spc25 isoform X3 n=1 Tax=Ictidomys tridecemlineatus TaxID=43179 RepID=UPI001A9F2B8B|nr:kinetochore protein Spc25 isoform X3 [Ictidomys tridecemlineatus]